MTNSVKSEEIPRSVWKARKNRHRRI